MIKSYVISVLGAGLQKTPLSVSDPLSPLEIIYACPQCKSIETFSAACDKPGCWEIGNVGTLTPNGHLRVVCHKHSLPPFEQINCSSKIR